MRPSRFKRLLLAVLLCGASTLSAVERAEYERLVAEFTPDRFARVEAASRIQVPVRDPGRATEPPLQILSSRNRLVLELGRELRAPSREEDCDDEAFASRTGAALVEHVRASPYACLNRLFVSAPGSIRFAAFRAQNMIDVATATQPLAAGYDGTNADSLAELALFLRIGYYNFFYESEYMDWTGRVDEIDAAVVAAIDAFVENDHFHDDTDAHEDALWEVVTLMDSSEQQARYVPAAMSWLGRWAPRHLATELDGAVNQFFVMLFRGHHQPEFAPATAADTELMETLRDFALADWMLDTDAQYLAENAGRELARFGQYRDAAIFPSVSSGVRTILERYDPYGEGRFVWIATAATITYHDDCASYGICEFRAELEAATLPIEHTCSESTRLRVQNLTETELLEVCALLTTQEAQFHRQLRTGGEPVAGDFNSAVEVVVFAEYAEYAAYSWVFFGNDTNNGGIYLEGDPREPSNTARFIAHRATWLEDEPVWNLEHELVHYLDGRFNMQGGFGDYGVDSHNTVWWLEGLAEYASKANTDVTAVEVGRSAATRLSEAFEVTYNDNSTAVYRWSYLATRFMFERHRDDVDVFLRHFRAGDYDGYPGLPERRHRHGVRRGVAGVARRRRSFGRRAPLSRGAAERHDPRGGVDGHVSRGARDPTDLGGDDHRPALWQSDPGQDIVHLRSGRLGHGSDGAGDCTRGRQRHSRDGDIEPRRARGRIRFRACVGDGRHQRQRAGGVFRHHERLGPGGGHGHPDDPPRTPPGDGYDAPLRPRNGRQPGDGRRRRRRSRRAGRCRDDPCRADAGRARDCRPRR